jgi:hypothetical protein
VTGETDDVHDGPPRETAHDGRAAMAALVLTAVLIVFLVIKVV